jgi:hypothetical protein
MSRQRRPIALVALLATVVIAGLAPVASAATPASVPRLVEIRAAHHPGFDRVVFEFQGGLPDLGALRWASNPPTLDPSDLPSFVQGNAFITVVFMGATGMSTTPPFPTTYGPARRAYDLPNVSHLVVVGDYEAVIEVAIGVMARTDVLRATALHSPSRWVIEAGTGFARRTRGVRFVEDGSLTAVTRAVPATGQAHSLLHRLFAGPTIAEKAAGLRFVASGATGFSKVRVSDNGIARVWLTGRCLPSGAITVADEIIATLRPLPAIDWVKVYDPQGRTQEPWGEVDSIPACLEP